MSTLILEPNMMIGEGDYNLNTIQEIKATESYLRLDQKVTGCQTADSYQSCFTRNYIGKLVKTCDCLPLSMAINETVKKII